MIVSDIVWHFLDYAPFHAMRSRFRPLSFDITFGLKKSFSLSNRSSLKVYTSKNRLHNLVEQNFHFLQGNFACFLSSADFFQNQLFRKILSGIPLLQA